MFFNWFRQWPNLGYESKVSPLRIILLGIVFGGMCWAFWANSERYTTRFSAAGRFHDEIGAFNSAQKQEIIKIINRVRQDAEVRLRVRAQDNVFTSTDAVEGEILFGISPAHRQVVIFMPALWRAALGESFIQQLRGTIIEPAFENGNWREATINALLLMERRLVLLAR